MTENHAQNKIYFDPDLHTEDTLKAFNEYAQLFELRYAATYPDPPKVSMDSAIQRWKIQNGNQEPTIQQFDEIRDNWREKDRTAKCLGLHSSPRLYSDWKVAEPDSTIREASPWKEFVKKIQLYYKPTENMTLKNFKFRDLTQQSNESLQAFCNRVGKEAIHCELKCQSPDCTAQDTAVRDQIVIGMISDEVRQEALKNSWSLSELRTNGMRMESAYKGASEIAGENQVNKMGRYSFRNMPRKRENNQTTQCFSCGYNVSNIRKHIQECPAKKSTCNKCGKTGHYARVCRSDKKTVKEVKSEDTGDADEGDADIRSLNIDIFRITRQSEDGIKHDFKAQVVVNSRIEFLLADTGAKISVCSKKQAQDWKILQKMRSTQVRIKPYNSPAIPVLGIARCAVTFGARSVPVLWHIMDTDCETVLAGNKAEQLGIIGFAKKPELFQPINMIEDKTHNAVGMQKLLTRYPTVFSGIGKLEGHQVKLHVKEDVKPVVAHQRPVPYHLKERVDETLKGMMEQDIIEEHPKDEPAPWISNMVIIPKEGGIRVTLDAKKVNQAIESTNLPIPRQEDIKAKLSQAKVFSKMDLKSAFWQLELEPSSRQLTVFSANDKLYRYKRLSMGLAPAQGELNAALRPLFAHIPAAHVIHDDLIVATDTEEEHIQAIREVMEAIVKAGITLNPEKCLFYAKEIEFWGMIFGKDGVRPDPKKVKALENLEPPKDKSELISFICMMQSNAEFMPEFAKKASKLRELTKKDITFKWTPSHQEAFNDLLQAFKEDTQLRYFDCKKKTFIFTDAHITGLSALLAQGDSVEEAKPVAVASRTTTSAETRYSQIDLEAMSVDFGLRRFRNYVVGAPGSVTVVTDHQPLKPIFENNRPGSIRTERIKLRHQDINYKLEYQKGKLNQADFLSRHAQSGDNAREQKDDELSNLLYLLHTTPATDCMDMDKVVKETNEDAALSRVKEILNQGYEKIPKHETEEVLKFKAIYNELTVSGRGLLLKGDRIVLPRVLQKKAIEIAHRGAHPGIDGLCRRLRYNYFFHEMNKKVTEYTTRCEDCLMYTDKKTKEPIQHHIIPERCWEKVSVDLYGPMPSKKHVVVVQDVTSRFPAAKIVNSTKAEKVIPAMKEIYNTYGNPVTQISDNGPPFNSRKMVEFTTQRGIEKQLIPPHHPSANPVENFMRPLGKAMKIGAHNGRDAQETLDEFLSDYKQTPHPATGLTPADRMFRDGIRSKFPRKHITDEAILKSAKRDQTLKEKNQRIVNDRVIRKTTYLRVGDTVISRNFQKNRKFDPIFLSTRYQITLIEQKANRIKIRNLEDGAILWRHPDDLKIVSQETKADTCPVPDMDYVQVEAYDYSQEEGHIQFRYEGVSEADSDKEQDGALEDIEGENEGRVPERENDADTESIDDDVDVDYIPQIPEEAEDEEEYKAMTNETSCDSTRMPIALRRLADHNKRGLNE